jgi:hypothetical protein
MGFVNIIECTEGAGVSVGIREERVSINDMIRDCIVHEILVGDLDNLVILDESGGVLLRKQSSPG